MSNAIYPALPGLGFEVIKEPVYSTLVQRAVSGKELRIGERIYPIYNMSLVYNFLRDTVAFPELKSLGGFFLLRYGQLDNFLLTDPDDNTVSAQTLGTGNGSNTDFQAVRPFGSFLEPVFNINAVTQVTLNGTPTAAYTLQPLGVIRMNVAPGVGVVVGASFTFYFRCRFAEDKLTLSKFLHQVWKAGKVSLIGSLQDKI